MGPIVPVPDDAPAQDHLLGFLGRDPPRAADAGAIRQQSRTILGGDRYPGLSTDARRHEASYQLSLDAVEALAAIGGAPTMDNVLRGPRSSARWILSRRSDDMAPHLRTPMPSLNLRSYPRRERTAGHDKDRSYRFGRARP